MKFSCVNDYAAYAKDKLSKDIYDFFAGGSDDEITLRANRSALDRIKLRPRVMRGQFDGKLSGVFLNTSLSAPIVIAPTAFHCLAHKDGEVETALAASEAGIPMIISMASTLPIEEITHAVSKHEEKWSYWFQVYVQSDLGFTQEIIRRAEKSGCSALVVSVDSPALGRRRRDLRNGFLDLPEDLRCPNLIPQGKNKARNIEFKSNLSWKDIEWLQSITTLPIVLKGIMHPDDARIALENHIEAIIVSNHGGRQLDSVAASIDLLPLIAAAVDGKCPIIMDGGIRRGTDILKALALGADIVGIGRAVLWGLAQGGKQGVLEVIRLLRSELELALQLCGCVSLRSVNDSIIFNK